MRYFYAITSALIFLSHIAIAEPTGKIEFVENKGQWEGDFLYKSSIGESNVFLEKNGFTYVIADAANTEKIHEYKDGHLTGEQTLRYHAYKVRFIGAQTPATITGTKPQRHYYNYFLGNDPAKWKSELHPYLAVDYTELYKNIDLHISSEGSFLKYDIIVKAGGNAENIKLQIDGADELRLKKENLQIITSTGTIEELKPYAYQYINGLRKEVTCLYRLKGNQITYYFPDGYDKSTTLVIDPTVVFSTYTGSTADNWGFTATYDPQGNFYAGGIANVQAGTAYPTTTGAFQTTFGGGSSTDGGGFPCDMAITKFNSTGTALIYSTYLGGSSNDQPHSIIVDNNGNLLIAGRTYSNDFPVTGGAFDNTYNGNADLVVTNLNASGTALNGSTYIGGTAEDAVNISATFTTITGLKHSYGDDARSEVIVDNAGNVYVAGPTRSPDFPTASAFQNAIGGQQDGFVLKMNNNLSTLTWSTFLGGSADDAAYVLALDQNETNIYVAGGTSSGNFPTTAGTLFPNYQGGTADGFIAKFQNSGAFPLLNSTFIGRTSYDQCYGIQVDMADNVYAMGHTLGGTFPVTASVGFSNPGSSQFVIKLNPTLSTNIYSTVFGTGNSSVTDISPVAFLVDTCENVYISGWGGTLASNGGSTTGLPVTTDAADPTTDGNDFYFIVLSKNAQSLLYGTFWGGNNAGNGEHVDGGTSRFDKNGVVYQAICAGCGGTSSFPTTPGVWSPTNQSSNCNLGAIKIAFNLTAVVAGPNATPKAKGCPPFTVNFQSNSVNATQFEWDFGDGSPINTNANPTHTFTSKGVYNVRLIVINPNACITRDTGFVTIIVDTNSIEANFASQLIDTCDPFTAAFTNISQYSNSPGAPTFTTFQWNFGDGSTFTGTNPPTHAYANAGTYTVTLVMTDTSACNSPDTVTQTITFDPLFVKAEFAFPDSLCERNRITFSNSSVNGLTYKWYFSDGDTSTESSPVKRFDTAGTYTIKLVAYNPNSCNKADSITKTLFIRSSPIADFYFQPVTPITNEPHSFFNTSQNAVSYVWDFGDGSKTTDEVNPIHLFRYTGSFTVCLIAKSANGCYDTLCKRIDAEILPLADIPSAFTPNGDGVNDVLYVRGAGIEKMNLKIFNRWGEMVFETNELEIGWDGTFKGKKQDMEAYAYVLNVTFIDGSTFNKRGNVTLLR